MKFKHQIIKRTRANSEIRRFHFRRDTRESGPRSWRTIKQLSVLTHFSTGQGIRARFLAPLEQRAPLFVT